MMQCLFDKPLNKSSKHVNRIWFFLRSGHLWIIWCQRNDLVFLCMHWLLEKAHQVVRESLIESQHTLSNLEEALDVAYQDVLCEFDFVWCVKVLL